MLKNKILKLGVGTLSSYILRQRWFFGPGNWSDDQPKFPFLILVISKSPQIGLTFSLKNIAENRLILDGVSECWLA